jgi:hypothetical protein
MALLIPAVLILAGIVVLAKALAWSGIAQPSGQAVAARIRFLESLGGGRTRTEALLHALDDPQREVAAVAAVLLREDLRNVGDAVRDKPVPAWRR